MNILAPGFAHIPRALLSSFALLPWPPSCPSTRLVGKKLLTQNEKNPLDFPFMHHGTPAEGENVDPSMALKTREPIAEEFASLGDTIPSHTLPSHTSPSPAGEGDTSSAGEGSTFRSYQSPESKVSKSIFVVAGEASGDTLGSALIQGLGTAYPFLSFCGVGGPLMEAAGSFASLFPMTDLSHMGFGSVMASAPLLIRRFYQTLSAIRRLQPRGLLTIDSRGFCLRLGRRVQGIPRVHCVAPSRAPHAVQEATDHVLALFPQEASLFPKGTCSFIGHPLFSTPRGKAEIFWEKYGPKRPLLCLLPGSRSYEIKNFWPVFLHTAQILRQHIPHLLVATVCAPGTQHFWPAISPQECLRIPPEEKHHLFAATTLALAASGTVTLELAHQGTPMVMGYKVSKVMEWVVRRALRKSSRKPIIGLVNILAQEPFVPEYLQEKFNSQDLSHICRRLLSEEFLRQEQSRRSLDTMATLWAGEDFGTLGARVMGRLWNL